ncbi:hypothetical protein EL22_05570 [Halostagnicola sp. A56]|uniref:hypothetical protein n=1 Tax=Halostagnicola sp. A56 TaxID=1495067 RepID=UPI0004A0F515|nr:hypothetical protein [Halostagnicola sp. A56]KDE58322.1 hypothetical protein EL22_05570 [Halostagnicola sp. A56]
MARIQHIEPTPTNVPESATVQWDWSGPQWASEGTYDDVDYPEPAVDERVFFTIAVQVGRKRNIKACVDVLAVTADLEYAIEVRLPATLDAGYQVYVRDRDGVPANFVREHAAGSMIPEERHEQYGRILEKAHGIASGVSDR